MKTSIRIPEIKNTPEYYYNLNYEEIYKHELGDGQTRQTKSGAMAVDTGIYTGRSPKDRYLVQESTTDKYIWWGEINRPVSERIYEDLKARSLDYLSGKPLYVFDGYAGARKSTRMPIRIITEHAWQHHFCTNMFIRATEKELESFEPEFTVYNASGYTNPNYREHGLNSEIFVIFHPGKKEGIIGGTLYGGEMKKGIFSMMNFYRPLDGVLTMHCSANSGSKYNDTALFFGLSGTGKTTLSNDPHRPLIGDDEHGWDDRGIWNLEGGCYAKVIHLDEQDEPEIYNAIRKNALLENVVMDNEGSVDYDSDEKTENTRVSYPIFHIENRIDSGLGGHPDNIVFLTADAFGVLPPVSFLDARQASYHFLSGYTAKVAGTERGVKEPRATFSTCFGAAFMTLQPTVYAKLLTEKIDQHNVRAWLVNTGWAGGPYGKGARMKIKLTRRILNGIFEGELNHEDYTHDPIMNLQVPDRLGDLDESVLHPWNTWDSKDEYDQMRIKLASMFIENFKQYNSGDFQIADAGPQV